MEATSRCLVFAVLLLSSTGLGRAEIEHFMVKDQLSTVRMFSLDGNRLEEQIFDSKGMARTRVLDLDTSWAKETLPVDVAAPRDGIITEETPVGTVRWTFQKGVAVERALIGPRPPDFGAIRSVAESMIGTSVVRGELLTPPGGVSAQGFAYAFYLKLGLFIPWTMGEQSIFGSQAEPGRLKPGDLLFVARTRRGTPEVVAVSLGSDEVAFPDTRAGRVVRCRLSDLEGQIVQTRRVIGTVWQDYLSRAPDGLLTAVDVRKRAPAPRWNRIQGLASFYDHHDAREPVRRADGLIESHDVSFAAGQGGTDPSAPNHLFTMAHRSLPLGSRVKVTLLETGRWCVCTVADRGYFENERSFEVCFEAARAIGLDQLGAGVVEVEVAP